MEDFQILNTSTLFPQVSSGSADVVHTDLGEVSGDVTLDLKGEQSCSFFLRATDSISLSFLNAPADKICKVLLVTENAGRYAVTWPTGTSWNNIEEPILSSHSYDKMFFDVMDGGDAVLGSHDTYFSEADMLNLLGLEWRGNAVNDGPNKIQSFYSTEDDMPAPFPDGGDQRERHAFQSKDGKHILVYGGSAGTNKSFFKQYVCDVPFESEPRLVDIFVFPTGWASYPSDGNSDYLRCFDVSDDGLNIFAWANGSNPRLVRMRMAQAWKISTLQKYSQTVDLKTFQSQLTTADRIRLFDGGKYILVRKDNNNWYTFGVTNPNTLTGVSTAHGAHWYREDIWFDDNVERIYSRYQNSTSNDLTYAFIDGFDSNFWTTLGQSSNPRIQMGKFPEGYQAFHNARFSPDGKKLVGLFGSNTQLYRVEYDCPTPHSTVGYSVPFKNMKFINRDYDYHPTHARHRKNVKGAVNRPDGKAVWSLLKYSSDHNSYRLVEYIMDEEDDIENATPSGKMIDVSPAIQKMKELRHPNNTSEQNKYDPGVENINIEPDGKTLWLVGRIDSIFAAIDLTDAWELDTASFNGRAFWLQPNNNNYKNARTIMFSPDKSRMLIAGNFNNMPDGDNPRSHILQYVLDTPGDVESRRLVANKWLDGVGTVYSWSWFDGGSSLLISSGSKMHSIKFSRAFDLTGQINLSPINAVGASQYGLYPTQNRQSVMCVHNGYIKKYHLPGAPD